MFGFVVPLLRLELFDHYVVGLGFGWAGQRFGGLRAYGAMVVVLVGPCHRGWVVVLGGTCGAKVMSSSL